MRQDSLITGEILHCVFHHPGSLLFHEIIWNSTGNEHMTHEAGFTNHCGSLFHHPGSLLFHEINWNSTENGNQFKDRKWTHV
jgi:hypothetical protein